MDNTSLSAGDILALTGNKDGGLGLNNAGGFILLFIFLMAISGNGFGFGGNQSTATALGLADLQSSLYNQTQDANSRALSTQIATLNDSVLNNKYDNAVLIKDLSNQMSNSIASIGTQIANQTATITNMFNQQTIDHLREVNSNLQNDLNNATQTGVLTNSINNAVNDILNAQGKYYMNPPCYNGCGCNSSLY